MPNQEVSTLSQVRNLYSRNGHWWARVTKGGKMVRHSLRTTDFDEAQRRLTQFLKEHRAYVKYTHRRQITAHLPKSVYFIGGEHGPIKIGIAASVPRRLFELQPQNAYPITLLASTPGDHKLERAYHRQFAAHRLHGEWFERAPEIMAEIERLAGAFR